MTFDEAIAADTLGLMLPEELPEVATRALCSGLESPHLAALAGESPRASSPDELHRMFARALRDLGIHRPGPVQAAQILRDYYARRVVAGDISPYFGAKAIVQGVLDRVKDHLPSGKDFGDGLGVSGLAALFYDYEVVRAEGIGSEEQVNAAIVEECRRILEDGSS